jgi:hypothetical protein
MSRIQPAAICSEFPALIRRVRYRRQMPPKGKKKGGDDADDMGLPAEGAPPIRGPEDAIQRLKEKSLLDRVAALYVGNRSGRQLVLLVCCQAQARGQVYEWVVCTHEATPRHQSAMGSCTRCPGCRLLVLSVWMDGEGCGSVSVSLVQAARPPWYLLPVLCVQRDAKSPPVGAEQRAEGRADGNNV